MKALDKPTIPEGLDLGNVTAAPVGTEIAVLGTLKGGPTVAAVLYTVTVDEGWRLLLRIQGGSKTTGAIIKAKMGASPYFMLKKWFYYSANPAHVRLAKLKIKAAGRRADKKQAALDAKMLIARPIGEVLGDGEAYDGDGQSYQSSGIADTLAERLTTEQLQTLSGWLLP